MMLAEGLTLLFIKKIAAAVFTPIKWLYPGESNLFAFRVLDYF